MKSPLIIIAAGGHAAELATYLDDRIDYLLGAIDDNTIAGPWQGSRVIGKLDDIPEILRRYGYLRYITAVGDNYVRRMMVKRIEELRLEQLLQPAIVQHSSSWCGLGVELGEGTLLAPHSLVTTRTTIGRHCILNVKASVSHDCKIGDYCNLNPGVTICGNVSIGDDCYIGAGAVIKERVRIGAGSTVGAGAVVISDVPPNTTAVGVPARALPPRLNP
ncbi:MAG: acetyltransferase [Pirellulales bacterium]